MTYRFVQGQIAKVGLETQVVLCPPLAKGQKFAHYELIYSWLLGLIVLNEDRDYPDSQMISALVIATVCFQIE